MFVQKHFLIAKKQQSYQNERTNDHLLYKINHFNDLLF